MRFFSSWSFTSVCFLTFAVLLGSSPAHAVCLSQTFFAGSVTVRYTNGNTHSQFAHLTFPSSCKNPHLVTQSHTPWINCGTGAGTSACLNNSSNIYTLAKAMVSNVSDTGADLFLSTDDPVFVGAISPSYRIDYQVTCDSPSGTTVSCDASPLRGGTASSSFTNGAQSSASVPVNLESCSAPVVLTQNYRDSILCGSSTAPGSCVNTPASHSTDIISALNIAPSSAGFSLANYTDDPVWVGTNTPVASIAHQTYCQDHPDPTGRVFGGNVDVTFGNGLQNSSSVHISVPASCADPKIVTQSYSVNARCGTTAGATSCVNNPHNIFTRLKSYISNVSASGFNVFLAADDDVWVGASSPLYRIGYIVQCAVRQCNDGLDNDSDGISDRADPGCWTNPSDPGTYDPTRDNEATATTQCQDTRDNDADGLIDRADPGCWAILGNANSYDRTRNSEIGGITECRDGLDNDGDGVSDATDPGCWTNSNDPNTYDANRNNEAAATTQCQDARDNDADGLVDRNDPGCWTVVGDPSTYLRTRNSELGGTPQCRDGLDNDGDGVSDAADPGCWSNPNNPNTYDGNRNNEAAATTQCQDGVDNDSDRLTDSSDPGCWTNPGNASTYDRRRNNEGDATAECQDGIDNDGNGLTDYPNDPGCSSSTDTTESGGQIVAPSNLRASDDNRDTILVTWSATAGASSYELYRSESPSDTNPALFQRIADSSSGIVGTSYSDTSAVPGRVYNYAVKAVSNGVKSPFSNVDSGVRPSDILGGDCDGDSVSDEQERIDGTGVCDGGSFALHLKSPAFSKHNTFLSQWNFLELIATGSVSLENVRVTVYSIEGAPVNSTVLSLAPQTQFDIDINTLVGVKDTYGVVRIDFDDNRAGSTLSGRMSNYRLNPDRATYSFALSRELRNATRGDTFASTNTFDPQGMNFLVPNWVEVVNLSTSTQTFVYRMYNEAGRLLTSQSISVPPLGERDLAGGHEQGQGVYLAEIHPVNGDAQYFTYVSRYSSNSRGGSEAGTYNYALALEGRAGNGSTQYAPSSNEAGGCYSQSNWLEVSNVRSIPVTASVSFRDQAGNEIGRDAHILAPKAQFHFNSGALLAKGALGSLKIDSDQAGSLLAQSLVYYHDCAQNLVQTAYATQSRIAGQDVQVGTANSFLGMENVLRMINVSPEASTASVHIRPFGQIELTPREFTLGRNASLSSAVNGANAQFAFPVNTYGTVKIQSRTSKQLVPQMLRVRPDPLRAGAIDFVVPTVIQ